MQVGDCLPHFRFAFAFAQATHALVPRVTAILLLALAEQQKVYLCCVCVEPGTIGCISLGWRRCAEVTARDAELPLSASMRRSAGISGVGDVRALTQCGHQGRSVLRTTKWLVPAVPAEVVSGVPNSGRRARTTLTSVCLLIGRDGRLPLWHQVDNFHALRS